MATTTITCPHCGYSKAMDLSKLPEGSVRATCPQCRTGFSWEPPVEPLPEVETQVHAPTDSAPQREEPLPPRLSPLPSPGLREIGELFTASWKIFVERFTTLFSLYLVAIVIGLLLPTMLIGGAYLISNAVPDKRLLIMISVGFAALIAGCYGFSWGFGALTAAVVDETLGIRDALESGKEMVWSFAWVVSLATCIITGGFLMFVIPGIIFSVWFFFGQFVLFDERTRGMGALLQSKSYVQGHWFDAFLRLFVIWLCSALAGSVPVAGPVIAVVLFPYWLIFQVLVYRDLKRLSVTGG